MQGLLEIPLHCSPSPQQVGNLRLLGKARPGTGAAWAALMGSFQLPAQAKAAPGQGQDFLWSQRMSLWAVPQQGM